ncbi:MAG: hypothetical protein K8S20_06100 [Chloroflexi bacterium]|nr:hypothetical protein [Chloroflexota bacterium]
MLFIVSDLHLGDGTTANSISPSAFQVFAKRLQETAYFASWNKDGRYAPIRDIHVILMGDILDPLHSTRWLDTLPGDANYIRPWSDPASPQYANKLMEVTLAILEENKEAVEVLRKCANGELISLSPADRRGNPDYQSSEQLRIKVNLHYMIGNHDWYYHLQGEAFDLIRREIIEKMGLSNPESPFPYDESESPLLKDLFDQYKVVAHHGDRYDKFNFDRDKGRDAGTIGDAFTMDVCNRYPIEAQLQYGDHLPAGIVDSLRRISNIRPVLAAPLWISGQIKSHAGTRAVENKLKKVWDRIAAEFLELDFVRKADKAYRFDMVDTLQLIIKISGHASFSTINDVVLWVRKKMWGVKHSFASHALQEPTFINNQNQFVVYGHTHQYEIVPLGMQAAPHAESQVYFNSGTWHSYYDLAIKNPKEQQFVPYQALTYVTFFRPDEHDGRRFETWSGAYA